MEKYNSKVTKYLSMFVYHCMLTLFLRQYAMVFFVFLHLFLTPFLLVMMKASPSLTVSVGSSCKCMHTSIKTDYLPVNVHS